MHLIGIWASFMRTILFNVAIFLAGLSIGMGFTIAHVRRALGDKHQGEVAMQLQEALKKHKISFSDIDALILRLKDRQNKES